MKAFAAIALLIALTSCTLGPLDELNYRTTALPAGSASYPAAIAFARQWAIESNLEVTDEMRPPESRRSESAIIELHSSKLPRLRAVVIVNGKHGIISASVAPARGIPATPDIASGAVRAFEKLYPSLRFEPFTRRQGLLGP